MSSFLKRQFYRSTLYISTIYMETLLKSEVKEIINDQLSIKLGQFTEDEFDAVLKKNEKRESSRPRRNIFWSMKNKEIWWHSSLIMQRSV